MSLGMSHLGERAAALVDGELGHAERESALSHVAVCSACRSEVEAQRRLKAQLDSLRVVEAPDGLEGRLRALAVPLTPPSPPGYGAPPGGAWTLGPPAPPVGFAAPVAPGGASATRPGLRRPRPLFAVAAAAAVLGAAAVAGAAVNPGPQRTVDPGADVFVVEHVTSTPRGPLADPAAGTLPVPAGTADSDTPGER